MLRLVRLDLVSLRVRLIYIDIPGAIGLTVVGIGIELSYTMPMDSSAKRVQRRHSNLHLLR